jgi:hypothetical protein
MKKENEMVLVLLTGLAILLVLSLEVRYAKRYLREVERDGKESSRGQLVATLKPELLLSVAS